MKKMKSFQSILDQILAKFLGKNNFLRILIKKLMILIVTYRTEKSLLGIEKCLV